MFIYIPMSGLGNRYVRAGYSDPKPLIDVDGKPMIERVLDMFPGEHRFLFTVNRQHAETTDIVDRVQRMRSGAQVHVIDVQKDGPVRAAIETEHLIPDEEPVLLSYCDMGCQWDFDAFVRWAEEGDYDGAVVCYTGFHPSLLSPTLYARARCDGQTVLEIREKHQFTDDPMAEYTSNGVHYFRRGADLKRFARELKAQDRRVKGELFVSLVSQLQVEAGQKVGAYLVDRHFSFGTPEDLRDYASWARGMRGLDGFLERLGGVRTPAQMVVPMAGLGKRFADAGYADPKPLIDVGGRPMIEQVLRFLPRPSSTTLVAREEHTGTEAFRSTVARAEPRPDILTLSEVTEGQAITAKIGVEAVDPERPVLIPPCDAGYVFDIEAWKELEARGDVDCVVWCGKDHLPSIWYPQQSGWIASDETGRATAMAVKKPIDGLGITEQHALTGTFWFRTGRIFLDAVEELVASGERVNGEWYIDTVAKRMIEQGRSVHAFVVDKFMPWGTPNELKTFFYWNDVHRGSRAL